MTLDWNAFTPWSSLAGGLLIGTAAVMLLWLNGRIAGISGILGGLLRLRRGDLGWRVAFLAGLVSAPLGAAAIQTPVTPRIDASYGALVLAGILVGLGTRYAGGCTSGHGVCGLSRLSLRSLVGTVTFMGAGFVTVFLIHHGGGR